MFGGVETIKRLLETGWEPCLRVVVVLRLSIYLTSQTRRFYLQRGEPHLSPSSKRHIVGHSEGAWGHEDGGQGSTKPATQAAGCIRGSPSPLTG